MLLGRVEGGALQNECDPTTTTEILLSSVSIDQDKAVLDTLCFLAGASSEGCLCR